MVVIVVSTCCFNNNLLDVYTFVHTCSGGNPGDFEGRNRYQPRPDVRVIVGMLVAVVVVVLVLVGVIVLLLVLVFY